MKKIIGILALLLLAAYLIGAFPSSYVVARLVRGIDLRQHGSGNLGATNAFRVLGNATTVDFAAHVDGPLGAIDLRARPDGTVFSTRAARTATRTWFADEVVGSYRQARIELGKPVDDAAPAVRVLVAGDSTSLNITAGLMEYGREHGTLVVE